MHGQFYMEVEDKKDKEKRILCMTKSDLKQEKEAIIHAAQEPHLRTYLSCTAYKHARKYYVGNDW